MGPPPTGTDRRYGYIRVLSKLAAQSSRAQYKMQEWMHRALTAHTHVRPRAVCTN